MRGFFSRIKYPKLLLLVVAFVFAYVLIRERNFGPLHDFLQSLGYFGVFLAGGFYAYGFTAPPAAAVLFSVAKEHSILYAGLLGGLGALVGDLVIFFFIRSSFSDELKKFSKERIVRFIKKEEDLVFGKGAHSYVTAAFAGFLIASPLPTEVGVAMLASLKHLSVKKFALIAYLLHTAGILIILYLGTVV